jgi:hypothetical protein
MLDRYGPHMPRRCAAVLASLLVATLTAAASAEPMPAVVALLDEQTTGDGFVDAPPSASASTLAPLPAPRGPNQLRLELGVGAPAGLVAVRYSRVLPTGTRIEPGLGLGYTGMLASLMVTQALIAGTTRTDSGQPVGATFELYGGYSASRRSDAADHAWTGPEQFIPRGTYHWIDVGISTQLRWRQLVFTTGLGVTKLVAGPADIGGASNADDETFWFFFPEGWFGKYAIAPSIWTSVGVVF